MKTLKFILPLLAMVVSFAVTSCGSEDEGKGPEITTATPAALSDIIGKSWRIGEYTLNLYNNYKYEITQANNATTYSGIYTYNESLLVLVPQNTRAFDPTKSMAFKVTKSTNGDITFTDTEGKTYTAQKLQDIDEKSDKEDQGNKDDQGNGDDQDNEEVSPNTPIVPDAPFSGDAYIEDFLPCIDYSPENPLYGVWYAIDHDEEDLKEYKINIFFPDGTFKELEYEIYEGEKEIKGAQEPPSAYTFDYTTNILTLIEGNYTDRIPLRWLDRHSYIDDSDMIYHRYIKRTTAK